jgi:valine dehydrogenase (NAD+)
MRASAEHLWGAPTLRGRRVGIAGVGKVGRHLVEHLRDDGATVVVADVSGPAIDRVRAVHPEVDVAADPDALITSNLDVYAPCALGGALDDDTVSSLRAKVVCGAANNQLAHPGIEKLLEDRGILYAPDYVVNSGGVIQVADEIEGFVFERAKHRATRIYDTTLEILRLADVEGVTPAVAADRLAERRMAEVGRLRTIHLPR